MKQKPFKNYIKLGILLFGVSLIFTNCETDHFETEKQNSKYSIKRIYTNEIKKNTNIVDVLSKLNNQKHKNNTSQYSKEIYDSEYNFTIETDEAIYIEYENYHSYTFQVFQNDDNSITKNLLLSLQQDSSYKAFLVSYNFTEQEKEFVMDGEYVSLTDKTTFTPLDNYDSDEILNNSSKIYYNSELDYCYELVEETSQGTGWTILVEQEVDCPDESNNVDDPNEIDAGDSATGGEPDTSGDNDSNSGGGGDSDSSGGSNTENSNPPDEDENCVTDSNGNCIGNVTSPNIKPETLSDPCDKLNDVSIDFGIKNALYDLTQNTNQESEKGYAIKQDPNTGDYQTPEATVNSTVSTNGTNAQIPMQNYLGNNYVGIFHTHPATSEGWIPMFSTGDINVLYYLALKHNTNGNQKNYSDYMITMTVPQGTYAIKIKDWQKFVMARNSKWDDSEDNEGILTTLNDDYENRDAEGDIKYVEKDILDLFKEFDMGVGLYKANDDLTEWSELVHDLNPLSPNFGFAKENPCNQL